MSRMLEATEETFHYRESLRVANDKILFILFYLHYYY